jgi:hypothetical protein
VHAIWVHHKNTTVLGPTIPVTIQILIDHMVMARTPIRMFTNLTATTPTTIRMPTSPFVTTPTTMQTSTTPLMTAPAPRALNKALMVAHNLLTHHMEIIAGILNSTSRMRVLILRLQHNMYSHIAAITKTLMASMVAFVRTYLLLVTTCRATMSIFGRR